MGYMVILLIIHAMLIVHWLIGDLPIPLLICVWMCVRIIVVMIPMAIFSQELVLSIVHWISLQLRIPILGYASRAVLVMTSILIILLAMVNVPEAVHKIH